MKKRDASYHRPYTPKPFAAIYLILVLIGGVVASAAYLGILWIESLPPLSATFQEKESAARLEAVKVALTTVAGLAAASGLYVGYRRQRVEEWNSSREQDRVFTERFGAATSMLAHGSAAVRLAGVQSLARLADDSARDRYTCLSALCSYLRIPAELAEDLSAEDSSSDPESQRSRILRRDQWRDPDEWDVRRNALRLLSERLGADAPEPWDLREAVLIEPDLSIVRIKKGIDARRAILIGDVTLNASVFLSPTRFEECLFGSALDVVGTNSMLGFEGSKILGTFTFRMTDSLYAPTWGMMPLFERCIFLGDAQILTDLTSYVSQLNFEANARPFRVGRVMASSVTVRLTGAIFSKKVSLSTHALDVSGANFGDVDEIEFVPYGGSAEMAPLEYNSETLWPNGFPAP